MPQFALPDWTTATLVHVTPRQEMHGEDKVVALTMRFRLSGPNTLLDLVSPTLRLGIFAGKEGQQVLPGVDEPTPFLRCKELEGLQIKLPAKTEGATLYIDHGIEGDVEPITLGDVKVDKFTGAGYDGGSGDVEFNCGTSDVSSEELGIICGKLGSSFPIRVIAPAERVESTGQVIDGTSGHPGAGPLFDEDDADGEGDSDATDAFVDDVEEHGIEPTATTPKRKGGKRAAATA